MTRSTPVPKAASGRRPTLRHADVPSGTAGLPDAGEEASARPFARDMSGRPPGIGNDSEGSSGTACPHVPALPRDEAG